MANLGYLQLTRNCYQKCQFCSNPPTGVHLDEEEMRSNIDRLVEMGYDGVILTGGEPSTSELLIPAPLEASEIEKVQGIAVRAFVALECSGLARVDCFLERNSGKFYLNEINTLPGFTSISMYPKLWAVSGTPYPELLTRLIDLARDRKSTRLNSSHIPLSRMPSSA